MNLEKYEASKYKGQIEEMVKTADALRKDKDQPQDISLGEIVQEQFEISYQALLDDLGIDPTIDTINNSHDPTGY